MFWQGFHPGKKVERANWEYSDKNKQEAYKKEREEKNLDREVENRKHVVCKMREYMASGMTPDDAAELVYKESPEIVAHFDYLIKAGVDLKQCFINWSRRYVKPEKLQNSNDGEER